MYMNSLGECKLKQLLYKYEHPEASSSSAPSHSRPTPRQYIVSLSSSDSSSDPQQLKLLQQKAKQEEEERQIKREVDDHLRHALEVTERSLGVDHIEVADIFLSIILNEFKKVF